MSVLNTKNESDPPLFVDCPVPEPADVLCIYVDKSRWSIRPDGASVEDDSLQTVQTLLAAGPPNYFTGYMRAFIPCIDQDRRKHTAGSIVTFPNRSTIDPEKYRKLAVRRL